jgi:hypothetical protein
VPHLFEAFVYERPIASQVNRDPVVTAVEDYLECMHTALT